jgi:hypothetical protein
VTKIEPENVLIGTYPDFKIIRLMHLDNEQEVPYFDGRNWVGITGVIPKDLNLSEPIDPNTIDLCNTPVRDFYVDVNKELREKYYTLMGMCREPIDRFIFSEGEFFEQLNQMKADDGGLLYRHSRHICFVVYKGMIPYNKGDIVSCTLYDCGGEGFITQFCTERKKKQEPNIFTFIRYIYV